MSQAGVLNANQGSGGLFNLQKVIVQTGTSPVLVSPTNSITFNGAVVAAGTHPVRTDGTAPYTMALEVQTSQAIASTDATKIGLAAFNSADFSVDANGFVTLTGSGATETLTGNTGGAVSPTANNINIVGSGGVTVAGNPGTSTLTITSSGVINWNLISASQTLAVNMGYFCTGGGALALLLPATSALGDVIEVSLQGSTSWAITQGAGQQIKMGNLSTTAGVGGSLTSTQQGDSIRMVCLTANLVWVVLSSMGNPTVV